MLGTFTPPAGNFVKSTPFNADANLGKPLIVVVRDYKEDFHTQAYPNPRPVVFVMIADVMTGEVFANAILGGDAVADRLKGYAGTGEKLPVKLAMQGSTQTPGRKYRVVEPLEGKELELAIKWDAKNPTKIEDERAKLEAEAEEAAATGGTATGSAVPAAVNDDALAAAIAALA